MNELFQTFMCISLGHPSSFSQSFLMYSPLSLSLFLTEMLSPQEVLLPRAYAGSAFAFFFLLSKYEMLSGMPIQSVVALSL